MTAAELKATLATELRGLAYWWGEKTAGFSREEQNWESMDELFTLASAVAAAPDAHPALMDLLSLPSAVSDALPTGIPNSVLLGAYGFAAIRDGGMDSFLDWVVHTMCVRWGQVA